MKLESVGILIGMRPLNERDAIAQVFTRDFGVMSGVLRGAVVAKKNKPLLGQMGAVTWNARLETQLGTFHWEPERNLSAGLLLTPNKLVAMNAAFALIGTLLPEREQYTVLYDETIDMLTGLEKSNDVYLDWEIKLLRELGYALNLSKCSGCGVTNNLNYLSPRTGRAVCDSCAQPYLDKLYRLPVSLGTTFRFLENICQQQGAQMPTMRQILKIG